jgi:hypothetical protein
MDITNIYNGSIRNDDGTLIYLKEFKVGDGKKFKIVNFKCAWFLYTYDNLIGPIKLDLKCIQSGKRIISDDNFPQLKGKEIINANKYDLTSKEDIPGFMWSFLLSMIE